MTHTPRQRLRLALLRAISNNPIPLRSAPGTIVPNLQSPISNILLIRPDHLGDLLFSTPTLRLLRQRYPSAHITALVGPWGAPILAHNPHVDEIITLPFPGFARQPKPSPWQPYTLLRRWARQLRGQYDLAFILRFDHWWGALLAYLARVPLRVGYAVPEVAPFLSHALPYSAGRHEVEQNWILGTGYSSPRSGAKRDWGLGIVVPGAEPLAPARSAGGSGIGDSSYQVPEPGEFPIEFYVPRQAEGWAGSLLRGDAHPIVIHPGAGAAIKLWRAEGWAAVADALARETGATILLSGSQAERPLCEEIARQMTAEARVMAGQTTLDQLAALFARCRLVLGLDSGPLHLAVAVGAPTVHIYGPVDTATFGPWGAPERQRALTSAWPCIPCNRLDYRPDELAHHPCVREIRVDEVLNEARQALLCK